ncbi:hypothetical protein EI427_23775 [Flammeovirga pectinis]|uniref:Uncharacterized protein n=1 Tax=Flammeovirga pectinis TaxID=2494373 RepID=A0A3S9PAK3_9BACT|nr:hypothetical protein [Flammeovirga pectinis]AZQ65236.1 hypothetical protein EI427_23775 [Flammeovirga pectinis]
MGNKAFRDAVTVDSKIVDAWTVAKKVEIDDFYVLDIQTLKDVVSYLKTSEISVDDLISRIPENVDFKVNWFKNVGKFGKVIGKKGDYVVEEAGEVFYRAIPEDHFGELMKRKKLLKRDEWKVKGFTMIGGEGSTSPKIAFSTDYDGVLVKYYVKKGTIDKLG